MKKIFEQYDIILSDSQEQNLKQYYMLLTEWNDKMNLTAITEYEDVIWKHFMDSALILKCPLFKNIDSARILDMGTGAGFPGIVLAILCPQHQFVLVDSLKKRIQFLTVVVEKLKLENVELYHGRAEEFGRKEEFRNKFDFVVSRAVAELPVLLEYCIPFVKVGGYFVSYKGRKYREEITESESAMEILSSKLSAIGSFQLEQSKEERYLLFIEKLSLTDDRYPRKPGKAKKNPL